MSDLYDEIISRRGSLERLAERLPGFRGYLDNKARREADELLRDHIANVLTKRIDRFIQIEKDLLNSDGGLSYMSKTANAKTQLQTYRDRVKNAAPGYSGFFEAVKVTPERLDEVYSFDEAQIRYADKLDEVLGQFAQAVADKSGIDEAISAVERVAGEALEAFSLRQDVLTNLSKSL